jgi:hypothetical protein
MIRRAVSIPSFSSKKGHIQEDVGYGLTAGTVTIINKQAQNEGA